MSTLNSFWIIEFELILSKRLCHIVHGPHDEPFHTLWNQLRTEHEQLLRKGYTGEGFLSTGHKLGGARIPMHEARRQARLAAEKRKALTAGSGQKLGGTGVRRGEDIRKVIADAAQRRVTVTQGCASGTDRGRGIVEETNKSGFRTKAENHDENDEAIMLAYIDLIEEEEREKYGDAYVPTSSENPAGSQGAVFRPSKPSKSSDPPPIPTSTKPYSTPPLVDLTTSAPPSSDGSWTCDICTLVNPSTYLCCDACSTERPTPPSSPKLRPSSRQAQTPANKNSPLTNKKSAIDNLKIIEKAAAAKPKGPMGWLCHNCGNWMESEWWTCASCGSMKLTS